VAYATRVVDEQGVDRVRQGATDIERFPRARTPRAE
jgi:hypothetical protein